MKSKKSPFSRTLRAAQRAYELDLIDPLVDEGASDTAPKSKSLPTGTRYKNGIRSGQIERPCYKPSLACRRPTS